MSFSYNFIVNLSLYNIIMKSKHKVIKELHCNRIFLYFNNMPFTWLLAKQAPYLAK